MIYSKYPSREVFLDPGCEQNTYTLDPIALSMHLYMCKNCTLLYF